MTVEELQKLLEEYIDAMNNHDVDRLMQCYTDDAVRHDTLTGKLEGKEELKGFYTSLFTAFPDLEYSIENVLAIEDMIATEAVMEGTQKGLFPPFESYGVSGKHVELAGAVFYQLKDGKISEERVYTDYGSLVQQLGLTQQIFKKAA